MATQLVGGWGGEQEPGKEHWEYLPKFYTLSFPLAPPWSYLARFFFPLLGPHRFTPSSGKGPLLLASRYCTLSISLTFTPSYVNTSILEEVIKKMWPPVDPKVGSGQSSLPLSLECGFHLASPLPEVSARTLPWDSNVVLRPPAWYPWLNLVKSATQTLKIWWADVEITHLMAAQDKPHI